MASHENDQGVYLIHRVKVVGRELDQRRGIIF